MYICLCKGLTQKDLENAIDRLSKTFRTTNITVADIQKETEAGTYCGCCIPEIQSLIQNYQSKIKESELTATHSNREI